MNKFERFIKDEEGVTAIEYGLIAAAIGLVLVATMPLLSTELKNVFGSITTNLQESQSAAQN